jgi:hypothetical protein
MVASARSFHVRIVAVAIALLIVLVAVAAVEANTRTVPGDYPTVQAAVDAINAQSAILDTLLVSAHFEPSPLQIHYCDLTVIGVADPFGTLPTLPRTFLIEGNFVMRNLHILGPIEHWGETEFRGCEIDSGVTSVGQGNGPGLLRFVDCTLKGNPPLNLIHYVTVDSCQIFGRIIVDYPNDGGLNMTHTTMMGPGAYAIALDTSNGCDVEDNVIRGFDNGFSAAIDDGALIVRDNLIEDCPGVALHAHSPSSGYADFSGNRILACGVGIAIDEGLVSLTGNVILGSTLDGIRYNGDGTVEHNVVGRSGGTGIVVTSNSPYHEDYGVRNNTSFSNGGSGFAIGETSPNVLVHLERNVSNGNHAYGLLVDAGAQLPELSCNDWFANDAGSVSGTSLGATDLEVDPRFCDAAHDVVYLQANSPLIDAAGCGQIGALGLGCAAVGGVHNLAAGEFALERVSPNPGAGPTAIQFTLPRTARVAVVVFDLQGRRVAALANGALEAGTHVVRWTGRALPGTYLAAFEFPGGRQVRRFVRLR